MLSKQLIFSSQNHTTFRYEGSVWKGRYVKRVDPYYLVETGTSCWGVLIKDIVSVDGKPFSQWENEE